ncbi:C-type lectin domain family 9 member A-like [Hemitrygon akajei]
MHNDLRHQFTEMETKYRSVNETKAQICELLTSRREQTCSRDWVTNKDRCYYVSTFETSFPRAMQECSNRDSRLLEINSRDESSFVLRSLDPQDLDYWLGQCANGNDAYGLLYKVTSGRTSCSECKSSGGSDYCLHNNYHFICEKSAPCCPDIPAKIQVFCQQPG